jgi:hypothetical protein
LTAKDIQAYTSVYALRELKPESRRAVGPIRRQYFEMVTLYIMTAWPSNRVHVIDFSINPQYNLPVAIAE